MLVFFQEVLWKRQKDMFLSTQVSKKKKMTLAIKPLIKHSLLQSVTVKIITKFPKTLLSLATNSQKASINQILETLKSGSKMVNIGWLQVI